MVDWDKVWTVGTSIGAGFGGGSITTWLTKRRERADKIVERQSLRDDSFRAELRQAYARFIDSYFKFLSVSAQMAATRKTLYFQREAADEEAYRQGAGGDDDLPDGGDPNYIASSERLGNEFSVANVAARVHLAEVLLLENHQHRQPLLLSIFDGWPEEPNADGYEEFETQLKARLASLNKLLVELRGMFSSGTWDATPAAPNT